MPGLLDRLRRRKRGPEVEVGDIWLRRRDARRATNEDALFVVERIGPIYDSACHTGQGYAGLSHVIDRHTGDIPFPLEYRVGKNYFASLHDQGLLYLVARTGDVEVALAQGKKWAEKLVGRPPWI